MSDYGKNFGFRRSEPAVREGRLRVPTTGVFHQGDLVTYDTATAGLLELADPGSPVVPGFTGLLVQEEGWDVSAFGAPVVDSNNKGLVLNDKPAVIMTGPGIKVWFKNTAQVVYHGRTFPAVTRVDLSTVVLGSELEWDGTAYQLKATGEAVMQVTEVGTDYVEAVLLG
jgi:hypothetical protein